MNDSRVFVDTNIYWDCLIMASALEHDCVLLYTGDLQNGQIIEKSLKIVVCIFLKRFHPVAIYLFSEFP